MKKALALAGMLAATSVGIVTIAAPVAVPANADTVARAPYIWRNVEIVGGGFVPGMVFSPREAGLIYARTDIGGAYRWNAKTKRWIPITDIFDPSQWNFLGIESIAPDPPRLWPGLHRHQRTRHPMGRHRTGVPKVTEHHKQKAAPHEYSCGAASLAFWIQLAFDFRAANRATILHPTA